jgi:DNA-binding XRE family transcriptional regulator
MTHEHLRQARESLGLTPSEAAVVLETDETTIRRMERDPTAKTARSAPARVAQLYQAYANGFRPTNWPERLLDRDARIAEIEEVRDGVV